MSCIPGIFLKDGFTQISFSGKINDMKYCVQRKINFIIMTSHKSQEKMEQNIGISFDFNQDTNGTISVHSSSKFFL